MVLARLGIHKLTVSRCVSVEVSAEWRWHVKILTRREIMDALRMMEWQIVGQLRVVFKSDSHKSLDSTFFSLT